MKKSREIAVVTPSSAAGKRFMKRMLQARQTRDSDVVKRVTTIVDAVRAEGDKALLRFTTDFDRVTLTPAKLLVSPETVAVAAAKASRELKFTIREAAKRITAYHKKQLQQGFSLKTNEGLLQQLIRPLARVGLYVPGGHTIYPSSVLMCAIPARVAGVKQIVAITPPRAELDPGVAYALKLLKITEIYRVGGAQGIAALAYGTKTIPAVDKIVGPGNAYVAAAKRAVYGTVDIDSVAGPSEVVILADRTARPDWIALDLLAQAEHGSGDELAVCVTAEKAVAEAVAAAVAAAIELSPVKTVIDRLPAYAISVILADSHEACIAIVNALGPEHLQIMTKNYRRDLAKIQNAAAIFLGNQTPVALGDYFVGTNHVLPTGSAARFASPLGVDSFVKRMSVVEVTSAGLKKAQPHVSTFARSEGFIHHALSVERRVHAGR